MSHNGTMPLGRTAFAIVLSLAALAGCKAAARTPHTAGTPQASASSSTPPGPNQGGYAIHDVWMAGSAKQNMDGVSCKSLFGPWHVVISGDLAAEGLTKLDAYYDLAIDPSTKNGTLSGEEHSVTTDGQTYDGPSTGTAEIVPDGKNYLIKLEIDSDITWHTPTGMAKQLPGKDHIKGHKSRELHIVSATAKDCG